MAPVMRARASIALGHRPRVGVRRAPRGHGAARAAPNVPPEGGAGGGGTREARRRVRAPTTKGGTRPGPWSRPCRSSVDERPSTLSGAPDASCGSRSWRRTASSATERPRRAVPVRANSTSGERGGARSASPPRAGQRRSSARGSSEFAPRSPRHAETARGLRSALPRNLGLE